jgi:ornithine cyclodeaminase
MTAPAGTRPTRGEAQLLLLDRDAVGRLLTPTDVLVAVREAFELHSQREGRVFPVIREQLPTGGVFGIKAGDVGTQELLGFKAAGFWPGNRRIGGEPHQATIMLIDPRTGRPLCVIDGNTITTVRTGAAGALGLTLLARPDSTSLTVFGTGVQAGSQLSFALQVLPQLQAVRYVSYDRQPDPAFEARFASQCNLVCAPDTDAAVAASDVVITATPGAGPLFSLDAVRPGTHLNCVGADTSGKRELPDGLLARAKVFADDAVQASQLGELQWAADTPSTELGDLLTKKARFSRGAKDITIFDMTGLALQDLTVARQIFQKAGTAGAGLSVRWPW